MIYVGIDVANSTTFALCFCLLQIAKYSFIRFNSQTTLQASNCCLLMQIELLDAQIDRIDYEMTDIMKYLNSIILYISGMYYQWQYDPW